MSIHALCWNPLGRGKGLSQIQMGRWKWAEPWLREVRNGFRMLLQRRGPTASITAFVDEFWKRPMWFGAKWAQWRSASSCAWPLISPATTTTTDSCRTTNAASATTQPSRYPTFPTLTSSAPISSLSSCGPALPVSEGEWESDWSLLYSLCCVAVELLCEAKRMTARMETNRIFDGLVYTKEQPKLCVNDVVNSSSFELSMPLDGSMCNTVSNGHGTYSNYIMIQYNRRIVTSKDVGLSVSCEYDLASQNVTGSLSTKG